MDEDKKEGFAYISPEKQRKTAFSILLIEGIVLLVVIAGIFIALNYLGILSFSKIFSGILNKPLTNGASQTNSKVSNVSISKPTQQPTPSIDLNSPLVISAFSEVKGYTLTIVDKKGLIDLLSTWNIYDKNHDYPGWGSTGNIPVKIVEVYFVNTDQAENVVSGKDGRAFTSSKLFIVPGKIKVNLYIAQHILDDIKQNKDSYLFSQFILTVLPAGQDINKTNTYLAVRKKIIDEVLIPAGKNKKKYFKLEKL